MSLTCRNLIALPVLLASLVFVGAAHATTRTVCASACTGTTISAVVAMSGDGDVINVAAGTYAGPGVVDEAITIQGAQVGVDARGRAATETIVTGSPAFELEGGAVVDGLSVSGSTGSGINVWGPATVRNVRITGALDFGIYVQAGAPADVVTIQQVAIAGSEVGINLDDSGVATVADSSIDVPPGASSYGVWLEGSGTSLSVTGSQITATAGATDNDGIRLNGIETGAVTINENSIVGVANPVYLDTSHAAASTNLHRNRLVPKYSTGDSAIYSKTTSLAPVSATYNWFGCITGGTNCTRVRGSVAALPLVTVTPSLEVAITSSGSVVEKASTPVNLAIVTSDGSAVGGSLRAIDGMPVSSKAMTGHVLTPAAGAFNGQGGFATSFTAGAYKTAPASLTFVIYDDDYKHAMNLLAIPPTLEVAPSIEGAPTFNTALSCKFGSWAHAISYKYRWVPATAPAPDATSVFADSTWRTVGLADIGKKFRCDVRATGKAGDVAYASSSAVTFTKRTTTSSVVSVAAKNKAIKCGASAKKACILKLKKSISLLPSAVGVTLADGVYAKVIVERRVGKKWKKATARSLKLPATKPAVITGKQLKVGEFRVHVELVSKGVIAKPSRYLFVKVVAK